VWIYRKEVFIISKYYIKSDVELTNIQSLIEKRKLEEKHVVYSMHSATLKNERLKANLTLNDITEGICSKSYLSKIENNLLSPDEFVMKKLFERVNINYDKLLKVNTYGNLQDLLNYYLYFQFDKIEEAYEQLNNEYFIIRESLIKLIYYLSSNKLKEFSNELVFIDEIKSSLSDYELIVLMFCTIEYYILGYQYINARKYLNIIEKVVVDDEIIRTLFDFQHFIVGCNTNDHGLTIKYYELLNNNNYYPMTRKYRNKLMYTYTIMKNEDALKILNDMEMDLIIDEHINEYYYAKCIVYSKLYDFESMVKLIIKHNLNTHRFVALLGYGVSCLYKLDRNIENINIYRKAFFEYFKSLDVEYTNVIHYNFIKLMAMEIKKMSNFEIIEYLKNYLNIKNLTYQHHIYTKYYKCKLYKLLGEVSRYKEIFLFIQDDFNSFHDLKFI